MKRIAHCALFAGCVSLAGAIAMAGCCDDDEDDDPAPVNFTQVERLGRPAINEGLFVTNDFLNAVNSIRPDQDADALVGPVALEAIGTLDALDGLDGSDDSAAGDWVAALIPDVMRVNTALAIGVGQVAFSRDLTVFGTAVRPAGGRKLHDDVIDIISTLLVAGVVAFPGAVGYETLTPAASGVSIYPVSDGAPYYKPTTAPQDANPAIGHNLLNGQAAAYGPATFPFLAPAN